MIVNTDDPEFKRAVGIFSMLLAIAGILVGLFAGWALWGGP